MTTPGSRIAAAAPQLALDHEHRDQSASLVAGSGGVVGPEQARSAAGTAENGVEKAHARNGLDLQKELAEPVATGDRFRQAENELAIVRLGMATSLYYAVRAKHPPTASHSLRVAMLCLAWCQRLRVDRALRDRLEVAALLHEVGKIGIPDAILKKPGPLSSDERTTMELTPMLAVQILKGCTDDDDLLDILRYSRLWFRSRREEDDLQGNQLPLGARMLAIVEAYDSMTTPQVYRRAFAPEAALAELAQCAGSQFDPLLVSDFQRMLADRPELLEAGTAQRWWHELHENGSVGRGWGRLMPGEILDAETIANETFFRQLLTNTNDGVMFVDREGIVREWNDSMHALTGVAAEKVCGQTWDPRKIFLCDRVGEFIDSPSCPILNSLQGGGNSSHHLALASTTIPLLLINLRVCCAVEKIEGKTAVVGAVAIFQDSSQQATLERRVRDLNDRVIRDPLTGVANRAELDRRLHEMCAEARDEGRIFSLVIADIDHFKQVNDVYGHPAGDEAILAFARLLSEHSRSGDMVARYGGEEFVLLCTGCESETAAQRAEKIRQCLESTPMSFLESRSITATFGVTQYQSGDTSEIVLARADKALLRGKEQGRNRVIQLTPEGYTGSEALPPTPTKQRWFSWFDRRGPKREHRVCLESPVPLDLVVEKLRGFITDQGGEILRLQGNSIEIRLSRRFSSPGRRYSDRRLDFLAKLQLDEVPIQVRVASGRYVQRTQTLIQVTLSPLRQRERRTSEMKHAAEEIVASLRSYLMADLHGFS